MNREIIFRGKRIDNGEWAYGSLVVEEDKYYIALSINDNIKRDDYDVYMLEVIPKTIGQYTGLHDKNGKEIYEGDIGRTFKEDICVVVYKYNGFWLKVIDKSKNYRWVIFIENNIEVIGNIYDNPELLGGE